MLAFCGRHWAMPVWLTVGSWLFARFKKLLKVLSWARAQS